MKKLMKKMIGILIFMAIIVVFVWNDYGTGLRNLWPQSYQAEPPLAGPPPAYPEIPPSTINLPLHLALDSIDTAVNGPGVIPTTLLFQDWTAVGGGADITYTVTRGTIQLLMQDTVLVTTVPITIKAGGRCCIDGLEISVWCNDINFSVQFRTTISLDENWKLQSQSTPVPYTNPVTCNVPIGLVTLPIDITSQTQAAINEGQRAAAQMIDSQVPSLVDAKAFAQTAWQTLGQPIYLGEESWLILNPEQLQVGSIAGNGTQLTVPIGIVARPQLLIGSQPVATDTSLPQLQPPDEAASGFRVMLEVELSYEAATERMAGLKGSQYNIGGHTVVIDDIGIFGAGSLAVIELTLSGDFKGTVYLTGTPNFDSAQEVVFLDEVDFDIHSRNLLVNTADWLFHEELLAQIESLAAWDVSSLVTQAREAATLGLNQSFNGLTLTGQIEGIELEAIIPAESAFKIIAAATGELSATASFPGQ